MHTYFTPSLGGVMSMLRRGIYLDLIGLDQARAIGKGNASAGIRESIAYVDQWLAVPPSGESPTERRMVMATLDDKTIETAIRLGRGNLSVGVRVALMLSLQFTPDQPSACRSHTDSSSTRLLERWPRAG